MGDNSLSDETIRELIKLSDYKDILPECICHYTGRSVILKIFQGNLSFKLTDINYFEDKNEGICFNMFYLEALHELENEGTISSADMQYLENLEPFPPMCILEDKMDNHDFVFRNMLNTYVGCFSEDYMGQYMIDNYILKKEPSGMCIKLYTNEILSWKYTIGHYGYTASLRKVLYGRDVVDHFKTYIKRLLQILGGVGGEMFTKWGVGLLKAELRNVRYLAKEEIYRKEHEYRIIVHYCDEMPENANGVCFKHIPQGILFEIRRNRVAGYEFVNMDSEAREEAERYITLHR